MVILHRPNTASAGLGRRSVTSETSDQAQAIELLLAAVLSSMRGCGDLTNVQ